MSSTSPTPTLSLMVRQITYEAVGVRAYELIDPSGKDLPAFSAGAHIDVHLPDGTVRQYSLSNDSAERHRYVFAVLRDEWGRGGSKAIHSQVQVQDLVKVGAPRNNFSLSTDARKHVLLAGGIGITPMKAMAHELEARREEYEIHYCAKGPEYAAFRSEFEASFGAKRVQFHFDGGNPVDGLDIASLLNSQPAGTHVYYCGPAGFMTACAKAAQHLSPKAVHFEHFKAPVPSGPARGDETVADPAAAEGEFSIQISSTGLVLEVPPNRTIVEVLADAAIPIETSCQSGLCATCKVGYIAGEVDHRDFILSDDEHTQCLTACVSRARAGSLLVLDL